jgi:hypothetical protein
LVGEVENFWDSLALCVNFRLFVRVFFFFFFFFFVAVFKYKLKTFHWTLPVIFQGLSTTGGGDKGGGEESFRICFLHLILLETHLI